MPRVADLGDCPLCFGKLLPLSVCRSCNSTVVRDRLESVEAQIACEDCGASNPTHFVCSACNARFPYAEVARPTGPTCPVCKSGVPPGAQLCPNCNAVLPSATGTRPRRRLRGEYGEADVRELSRIPGVTRERAEALCRGGYQTLWKVARATQAKLARVRGVGARAAESIKEQIAVLQIVSRPRTKEEVLSEELECPLCGTVTSLFSTGCHDCGAAFDEEELDEELAREAEREEDKGLLAYYDIRLLESPENSTLLYARALLLLSMGRPTDALASLDKYLEVEPGNRRALQAKVRALASVKGVGSAAQVLRGFVAITAPAEVPAEEKAEQEALRALRTLEEQACPECGERQVPGARECTTCGHRLAPEAPPPASSAPEAPPPPPEDERIRLLEDLERAVAGETKAPPPPLRPVVPESVVDRKRDMYTFLANIPGVSRRAAEAASAFFQDLDQIRLAEAEDLEGIPGVAPAEARLIRDAIERRLAPEAPAPEPPRAKARPPPVEEEPSPPPVEAAPPEEPVPRLARAEAPRARRPIEITAGRRGLVNGKGLVNGRGRVNGLINGTGFVNGGSLGEPHLPRQNLMHRYIAVGASLMMLFAIVAALTLPEGSSAAIVVDGKVGDWSGVPAFNSSETFASDRGELTILIVAVRYQLPDGPLFARVQLNGTPGTPAFGGSADYRSLYAFVDGDWDAGTGYEVGPIGADIMARVSGGGAIEETRLSVFESGSGAQDWNGWRASGSVSAESVGQDVELAIPTVDFEDFNSAAFRVVFAFDDNAGSTSHTEVPIGPASAALRVTQGRLQRIVSAGTDQPLLQVLLAKGGPGSMEVRTMSIRTAPDPNLAWRFTPSPPWTVGDSGTLVTVSVDTSGLSPGASVSAGVDSVDARLTGSAGAQVPYAIIGPEARAYVVQPAQQKRIDGLFDDWPSPLDDTTDVPPVDRPSLDIEQHDGAVVGSDVFLYADLAGPALEGGITPRRLTRPQQTGGTGGGGSPGPPPPPLIGQDYIRFYLDTNESEPGGYDVYGLLVDRYVEVRGRGGRVTDASLYGWNGSAWLREGSADAEVGGMEAEVKAAVSGASSNATRVLAVTGDWTGIADTTDSTGTRGTRGSPRFLPMHGTGADSIAATVLTNTPTLDASCGTTEYEGASSGTDTGFSFKVGRRDDTKLVWVCIDATGDGTQNTADWGELVFDTLHDGTSGDPDPQADDRRFRVESGSTTLDLKEKGDGAGWVACGTDCNGATDGEGAWDGTKEVYEFSLYYTDVWGTDTPAVDDRAGFAVLVDDTASGGVDWFWGSDSVNDIDTMTWGHLDIPEFPEVTAILVAVSIPVLAGYLRRRRR